MKMITKPKIIFTQESLPFILEALGKFIKDNMIFDIETNEQVLTRSGKIVTVDNLVSIEKQNWEIIQVDKVEDL